MNVLWRNPFEPVVEGIAMEQGIRKYFWIETFSNRLDVFHKGVRSPQLVFDIPARADFDNEHQDANQKFLLNGVSDSNRIPKDPHIYCILILQPETAEKTVRCQEEMEKEKCLR